MSKLDKVKNAYNFFKENDGHVLTVDTIQNKCQWSKSTIKTYLNKKWKSFIERNGNTISIKNFAKITKTDFILLMSQV